MKSPTPHVQAAFDHVRAMCPETVGVLFTGRGNWIYYDEWAEPVTFTRVVDVGLLEDAESSIEGPVAFECDENGRLRPAS